MKLLVAFLLALIAILIITFTIYVKNSENEFKQKKAEYEKNEHAARFLMFKYGYNMEHMNMLYNRGNSISEFDEQWKQDSIDVQTNLLK
jgi:uncharacterized protein YxeA